MYFKFLALVVVFFSFAPNNQAIADKNQIIENVLNEKGFYDADEITLRSLFAELDTELPPVKGGTLIENGTCNSVGCMPGIPSGKTGPQGFVPTLNNVTGQVINGSYTPDLIVKFNANTIPENELNTLSSFQLSIIKPTGCQGLACTSGSSDNEFRIYSIIPEFRPDGDIKRKQFINLKDLEPGDYRFAVRATYNQDSVVSDWSNTMALSVAAHSMTLADLPSGGLKSCLIFNGHLASDLIANIERVECVNDQLNDTDVNQLIDYFTGARYINISNNPQVTEVPGIGALPHLKILNISNNPNIETSGLWRFGRLDALIMKNMGQSNLAMPQPPHNAIYVNYSDNHFTTWDSISLVRRDNVFKSLNLANTNINDSELTTVLTANHDVFIEGLDLRDNPSLTSISSLNVIKGLQHLNLDSTGLQGSQEITGQSGLCSLSISNTEIESIEPIMPVQYLSLRNNSKLKRALLLHSEVIPDNEPYYRPHWTDLSGSNALKCHNHYNYIDNAIPSSGINPVTDFSILDGQTFNPTLPTCDTQVNAVKFQAAETCLPTEVQSIEVFEDTDTARRFIKWQKFPGHDYQRWGIDSFELSMYKENGAQLIKTISVDVSQSAYVDIGLEADKYEISPCTNNSCGYKRTAIAPFEQGLTKVENITQNWDEGFVTISFSYNNDIFKRPNGKPEFFKLEPTFPQPNNADLVLVEVQGNQNQILWHTRAIDPSLYIGNQFLISACRDDVGCGKPVSIYLENNTQNTINSITGLTATVFNDTHINLSWNGNALDDNVDYIKIRETQPELQVGAPAYLENPNQNNITEGTYTFYTEELNSDLSLERITNGHYTFELSACKRDRENGDVCSEISSANAEIARYGGQYEPWEIKPDRELIVRSYIPRDIWHWPAGSDGMSVNINGTMFSEVYRINFDVIKNSLNYSNAPDYYYFQRLAGHSGYHQCYEKVLDRSTEPETTSYNGLTSFIVEYSRQEGPYKSSRSACYFPYKSGVWGISACNNGIGCGEVMTVNLSNGDVGYLDINDNRTEQTEIVTEEIDFNGGGRGVNAGGPQFVMPGHYWDPNQAGTGWQFHWATHLNEKNPLNNDYGVTYDLIGYWFTYKKQFDPQSPENYIWTPTWYKSKLKYQDNGNYEGSLSEYQKDINGVQENIIGILKANLNNLPESNVNITVQLDVNSESLETQWGGSQQNSICSLYNNNYTCTFILENYNLKMIDEGQSSYECNDDFGCGNDKDHYSGVWSSELLPVNSNSYISDVTLVTAIDRDYEVSSIATFDNNGKPIWGASESCGGNPGDPNRCPERPTNEYFSSPLTDDSGNNLYTIPEGFNPLGYTPQGFWSGSQSPVQVIGKLGRCFSTENYKKGGIYLDINATLDSYVIDRSINKTLGTDVSSSILSCESLINGNHLSEIDKLAGFNNIEFEVNELNSIVGSPNSCDPDGGLGYCSIKLHWYTDGDFYDLKPFYKKNNGQFQPIKSLCRNQVNPPEGYLVKDFICEIDGTNSIQNIKFELRKKKYNATPIEWEPIGISENLYIAACDSNGCDNEAGIGQPFPVDIEPDPKIFNTSSESTIISHEQGAGPVPGSAGVSGGAATYQLPLNIPPGLNGMTPEVSIGYSSKGGNGSLGVGWSLSIGSTISRCPNTIASGATKFHAVNYTSEDRLCLDGQRLVKVSSGDYWALNTEYRTELNSFSKIVYNSNGSFTVYEKDGTIKNYEATDEDQGSIVNGNWHITKESDQKGNYIKYEYYKGTDDSLGHNEILVKEIRYTGHNNIDGNRKIKFTYIPRNDYQVSYKYGKKFEQTQKLEFVETYIGNEKIRSYELEYSQSESSGKELLNRVYETVYEEEISKQRKLFETSWTDMNWNNENSMYSYSNIQQTISDTFTNGIPRNMANLQSTVDLNGDGIKELFYGPQTENSQRDSGLIFLNKYGDPVKIIQSTNFAELNKFAPGDLNVDGINDFLKVSQSDGKVKLYNWKVGETLDSSSEVFSDFFKETELTSVKLDQAFMNSAWSEQQESCGQDSYKIRLDLNASKFFVSDYNNDGKSDILVQVQPREGIGACGWDGMDYWTIKSKLVWFENTTSNPLNPNFKSAKVVFSSLEPNWDRENEPGGWYWYLYDHIVSVDDFNGDGLPDFEVKRVLKTKPRWGQNDNPPLVAKRVDHKIYFQNNLGEPIEKSLTQLGLTNFKCVKSGNTYANEEACYSHYNSSTATNSGFGPTIMTFKDINGDGLKDLLYFDRGIMNVTLHQDGYPEYSFDDDIIRNWKVRLNKGGDYNGTIFESTSINSSLPVTQLGEENFLPQGNICTDIESQNLNDTQKSRLYRICNRVFRASTKDADLNADGRVEILYPNPDKLVFNRCMIAAGSSTRVSGKQTLNDFCSNATDVQLLPATDSGIVIPDNIPVAEHTSYVCEAMEHLNYSRMLTETSMDNSSDTNELDFLYENEDFLVGENQGIGCLSGGCQRPTYPTDPEFASPDDPVVSQENNLQFACSKGIVTSDGEKYDLYEDVSTPLRNLNPLWDRGVYEFSALEFSISNNTLIVDEEPQTGIFSTLFWGHAGDNNGDGLSDYYSPVGCFSEPMGYHLLGCNQSELNDPTAMGGIFTEDDYLDPKGQNLLILRDSQLSMPDMLSSIEYGKKKVDWTYVPISDVDVYGIAEREENGGDGYIDTPGAVGSHFYFNSSMYVVSEMKQNTNIIHNDVDDFIDTTKYDYSEAVYNNQGRGFQGFRTITTEHYPKGISNGLYSTSTSVFHQIFPKAGKLESIFTQQGNNETVVDYQWGANQSNHTGVYYRPIDQIETTVKYNGENSSTKLEEYTFDNYGNTLTEITEVKSYVDSSVTGSANEFKTSNIVESVNEYYDWDTNNWWVNKLKNSSTITKVKEEGDSGSVCHKGDSTCINGYGLLTETSQYYFWNNDRTLECQFSYPSISVNEPLDCESSLSPSPFNSHGQTKNQFNYDRFGNITSISTTGFDNNALSLAQEATRSVNTTYTTDGYFPQTITKGGLTTEFEYHPETGQIKETIQPGGIITTTVFDIFDLPIEQQTKHINGNMLAKPITTHMQNYPYCNGDVSTCTIEDYSEQDNFARILDKVAAKITNPGVNSYFFNGSPYARYPMLQYKTQTRQENSHDIIAFSDMYGNPVLSLTKNSGGDSYVISLTNPMGQTELITEPMTSAEFNDENFIPAYTFKAYDDSGHLIQKQQRKLTLSLVSAVPNDSECSMTTNYTYHGKGLTTLTANGCNSQSLSMSRSYDAEGRLRYTKDAENGETRYWYTAQGNPFIIQDAGGNEIITSYDKLGRKIKVDDPNMGVKLFRYNAFGEVTFEQDAKRNATGYVNYGNYFIHDELGRITNRFINSEFVSSFSSGGYYAKPNTLSYHDEFVYKLSSNVVDFKQRWKNATDSGTDELMHRVDYSYDEFLRPTLEKTTVAFNLSGVDGGGDFISTKEKSYYEENNWLLQETYRSNLEPGYSVVYAYTNFGENYKQIENPTGKVLSEITAFTPRGEVQTKQFYDNNTQSDYMYYHTGQVASINHTYESGGQIQGMDYAYDAWGNIEEKTLRSDTTVLSTETFTYDNLQRLYSSQVSASDLIAYRYDKLGNLLQKTDYTRVQDSLYGGSTAGPNAITTLYHKDNYSLTYNYDAAGNRIEDKRNGITKATYEYDAFNLLTYSQQYDTGNQILFRYGIDNQRYLKIEQSVNAHNSKTIDEVTLYAGPQFEAIRNDREGVSESKIHVTPYLTVTRKDDQTIRRHFKFQDRLGSTTLITKENGEKVKTLSYDAFGKPRNGEDWTALSNPVLDFQDSNLTADITKRGFTEHEHLDNFELIHMNGRMYDFNNGRFLSVDPFIQGTDSQAINPYSYMGNNPLSGTDPTGYVECKGEGEDEECEIDEDEIEREFVDKDGNLIVQTGSEDGDKSKKNFYKVGKINITNNGNTTTVNLSSGLINIAETESQDSITFTATKNGYLQIIGVDKNGYSLDKKGASFLPGGSLGLFAQGCYGKGGCSAGEAVQALAFAGVEIGLSKVAAHFLSKLPGFRWLAVSNNQKSTALAPFWPVNNGFLGDPIKQTLGKGSLIDRYGGSNYSQFFSPAGTPNFMRALPPNTPNNLRTFEVLKPFDVNAGTVAPAFNQIGLGVQYHSEKRLGELLKEGYLREVIK